jgi:hypothetical protein
MENEEIYRSLKNAIVTIKSVTDVQVKYNSEIIYENILVSTLTGFFIKDHYIVTAGHGVLFHPLSYGPFTIDRNPPSLNGAITRVQKIYVTVYHVNNSNKNIIYEASLVGVDGAGDVAVLEINNKCEWNRHLPKIKCIHPYFTWGESRKSTPGEKIIIMGNPLGEDPQSIISGVIRNNRNVQYLGNILTENITTDAQIDIGNSGSPIVNEFGDVIGIVTFIEFYFNADNMVETNASIGGGPTQYFIKHVIKELIYANEYNSNLEYVLDPFGNFYRYIKGFMGLSWNIKSEPIPIPLSGNTTDFNKRIIGMIITYIDPVSPFLNVLQIGDVITHIDSEKSKYGKQELGQISDQITPTIVTWKELPGNSITLYYRKQSENYIHKHKIMKNLIDFPIIYDYSYNGITSAQFVESTGNKISYKNFIILINDKINNENLGNNITLKTFFPNKNIA